MFPFISHVPLHQLALPHTVSHIYKPPTQFFTEVPTTALQVVTSTNYQQHGEEK